jgi:hypothetical protein
MHAAATVDTSRTWWCCAIAIVASLDWTSFNGGDLTTAALRAGSLRLSKL